MRAYVPAAVLLLAACPKVPPANDTAGGASESSSGAGTSSTSSSSSTSSTSTATITGTGGTATTAPSTATTATTGDECGNTFIKFCPDCPDGQLCVYEQIGDVGEGECVPNPDGCVPSDPCSPECKALCPGLVCSKTCQGLSCVDPVTCWIGQESCNDGLKCAPYDALELGTYNGTTCVPLAPDPDKVGEPCTAEGDKTGVDSCEKMAVCLDGVCVAECDPFSKTCPDPNTVCISHVDFVLTLCEPACDPLMSDCPDGQVCVPIPTENGDKFGCVVDASGDEGQYGDPCMYVNACDPGLVCAPGDQVPGCATDGCCTPYCDVTQPNTCPGAPEQSCEPWWVDLPPDDENLGLCGIPG